MLNRFFTVFVISLGLFFQPATSKVIAATSTTTTTAAEKSSAHGLTIKHRLLQAWQNLLVTPWLAGCRQAENYEPEFAKVADDALPVYIVGIHPLHNPKRLFKVYGPIVDYIDASIAEAHFKLEASRNYAQFEKKLDAGHFDFAMPNPYQTLRSLQHGYHVFGKMADDDAFRGIILLRRDSPIQTVADLKGHAVAYPAPTALAGTMMPQYYLHTHGLDINHDIENRYVGSQESSIMHVLLGDVAAGATWPVPWRTFGDEHPDLAAQLMIKWQTGTLPNNGWVVRKDIPQAIHDRVMAVLFSLKQTPVGQVLLARVPVSAFEPATCATYAPVQVFLDKFTAAVRPLER